MITKPLAAVLILATVFITLARNSLNLLPFSSLGKLTNETIACNAIVRFIIIHHAAFAPNFDEGNLPPAKSDF